MLKPVSWFCRRFQQCTVMSAPQEFEFEARRNRVRKAGDRPSCLAQSRWQSLDACQCQSSDGLRNRLRRGGVLVMPLWSSEHLAMEDRRQAKDTIRHSLDMLNLISMLSNLGRP